MLLVPCPSVHTFFLRFAIDLIMLDTTGQVVDVRRAVRPWRIVIPARKTFAILEVPAGSAAVDIGDSLALSLPAKSTQIPRSLKFLAIRDSQ